MTTHKGTAMAFRRRLTGITVAVVVSLLAGAPFTAGAQDRGGGPDPGARDLNSVLLNWTRQMGMLPGADEPELGVSLEYQGDGTIQVDGRSCVLSSYRTSINYRIPEQRIQYTCTRPNGQTHSNVEVVSGQYAWNEDIPDAAIVQDQGRVTPTPAALQERLIRLWAGPQSAPKAALAGAGISLIAMDRNPGALLEAGVVRIGNTAVSWESSKPVVTYPIPGVPGATAIATLNERYLAERVVVSQGSTRTEFTYGDYRDWNNPRDKTEAYYVGRLTERRNGRVIRDLTTTRTEIGSVYLVMPVPASVRNASRLQSPPQ